MAKQEKDGTKLPDDIQDKLNQMRTMSADLEKKLSGVYDKSGRSREELLTYLENPNNFTSSQWKRLVDVREMLQEKVYETLGRKKIKKLEEEKKKSKMAKDRKGKTLGGRKGWIPMR